MDAREELVDLLNDGAGADIYGLTGIRVPARSVLESAETRADAILAAGYRKMPDREAVEKLLADPSWERSNYVDEWPEDEAAAYRAEGWEPGRNAAIAILRRKQADAILALMEGNK